MRSTQLSDTWGGGEAYEWYCGRWSERVANSFVQWLHVPEDAAWLDVGCGTGRLTRAILHHADPRIIHSVDPSEGFISFARTQITDVRVLFQVGEATNLPVESATQDATVSGLVLNFIPDLNAGMAEMVRATKPGGTLGAYVWDYSGKMEFMRFFWDAAIEMDPSVAALDEGVRFPICDPDALKGLFEAAGLTKVSVRNIDVTTRFLDFSDYWSPFLGGQGPAPSYVVSLPPEQREALRDLVRSHLPVHADGSITLTARAWAVRAIKATS